VRATHRRRGHGAALMDAIERVIRGAYDLGALGATDDGAALYAKRGWRRWEGSTSALTPDGVVRTPEEDGFIYVLPVAAPLDLAGELTCDWREGDVW
jgi:aminoglycoside 2'-N-acetyltransferase I